MPMTNEQEARRELLLIALERCEDPGKALEFEGQMEGLIKNGGRADCRTAAWLFPNIGFPKPVIPRDCVGLRGLANSGHSRC